MTFHTFKALLKQRVCLLFSSLTLIVVTLSSCSARRTQNRMDVSVKNQCPTAYQRETAQIYGCNSRKKPLPEFNSDYLPFASPKKPSHPASTNADTPSNIARRLIIAVNSYLNTHATNKTLEAYVKRLAKVPNAALVEMLKSNRLLALEASLQKSFTRRYSPRTAGILLLTLGDPETKHFLLQKKELASDGIPPRIRRELSSIIKKLLGPAQHAIERSYNHLLGGHFITDLSNPDLLFFSLRRLEVRAINLHNKVD